MCEGPSPEQSKGLQPMGMTDAGAGEQCTEEGVAERYCYGLITAPHSPLPCVTTAIILETVNFLQ